MRFGRRKWPVAKYARQILLGVLHHAVVQPHSVCSVTSYPEQADEMWMAQFCRSIPLHNYFVVLRTG